MLWLIWLAPLRVTLGLVMVIGLSPSIDRATPTIAGSRLAPIGGLLFHNLNHVISLDALKFSGVFALVAYLLVIRGYRMLTGRTRDTAGSLVPAAPMLWAMGSRLPPSPCRSCSVRCAAATSRWRRSRCRRSCSSWRSPISSATACAARRDYAWLGKLIVVAACAKSVMALWVRAVLPNGFANQWGVMRELEYATNHGDSLALRLRDRRADRAAVPPAGPPPRPLASCC